MLAVELKAKKVLVVGLGRAGQAAAAFCARKGAKVTVTDAKPAAEVEEAVKSLPPSVQFELGGHVLESFTNADLVVTSPGVEDITELKEARKAGVQVIDEAELAARNIEGVLVGVTGTNGKSTVTVLLGKMLDSLERPTFVGGNLGIALIQCADTDAAGPDGIAVAELSSFQLERSYELHPHVAVLLNISEDHLDRHPSMEAYIDAKARVFANQREADWAIVNGDQPVCVRMASSGRARVLTLRDGTEVPEGGYLTDDHLVVALPDRDAFRIPADRVALTGRHNLANALAASVAASVLGVVPEAIVDALAGFTGLPHRMERVAVVNGVTFYNDSKATNVGSAVGSLSGLDVRFVLIAGGRHKGSSYAPLKEILERRAEALVLMGEAAELMERELGTAAPTCRAGSMEEAVQTASELARTGQAVVLCPACSSYDMFRDFEHRGRAFIDAVRSLRAGASS